VLKRSGGTDGKRKKKKKTTQCNAMNAALRNCECVEKSVCQRQWCQFSLRWTYGHTRTAVAQNRKGRLPALDVLCAGWHQRESSPRRPISAPRSRADLFSPNGSFPSSLSADDSFAPAAIDSLLPLNERRNEDSPRGVPFRYADTHRPSPPNKKKKKSGPSR